jgi:anti-sigma B factor antagonist
MKLNSVNKGKYHIVTIYGVPKGQLDLTNIMALREKMVSHIPTDQNNIILDFDKITYIDSSVIGMLVDLLNTYRNKSGSFGLVNINPKIRNILELANLTKYFSIYETVDKIIET